MTIKNVKVVNFDGVINNANVYIKDNKILKVEPIPGEGKKLMLPGMIDSHIHGFMGLDVMEGKEAVETIGKNLAKQGITSWMPTAMTASWDDIQKSLKSIAQARDKSQASRIIGIHIEGPFIGVEKKGAHKLEWLRVATEEDILTMIKSSNKKLKKISFDPRNLSCDLIKLLVKKDIIPSIGHSSATYQQAMDAYDAGASNTCHLWNAMSQIHHRDPGIAQASLERNDVYSEIIIDFAHICKETVEFTLNHKDPKKMMCISDAIKPAYLPDGESESGGVPVVKKGLLIKIKGTDTIAGSGICIYDAFKNLMSLNVKLEDIVYMTSYNAAQNSNLFDRAVIKPGYLADLLIINPKTLELEKVILNGREL